MRTTYTKAEHYENIDHREHIEQRESAKTDFLREQTECPICQGPLDIFVECVSPYKVKEEARCVQCMALSRVQDHKLH